MEDLLESLNKHLTRYKIKRDEQISRHSRAYKCRCGNQISFHHTQCPACQSTLGFLPDEGRVAAIDQASTPGAWRVEGRDDLLKCCGNRETPAACNWMMYARNPSQFCMACRLNRSIPDLRDSDNVRYWAKVERAKRRLVSELIALRLPVRSKVEEDPEHGLMFDFLRPTPQGPRVMTGHASGLITLNVEEADDAKREQIKQELREPYRTLVGHFRHEVGHYYWDRLICDTKWLEPFRQLFGDERTSYAEALKRNYEQGPPSDWADHCISSYATMHPWEDWAETWAHYLHIVDSLGTAAGFGLDARQLGEVDEFTADALYAPDDPGAKRFLALLNVWLGLIMVLNEMSRSMGQPDFYPFVMCKPVVAKLQFIQMVVADARTTPDL